MALLPRFHAPRLADRPSSVVLDADEAHHLAHVARVAPGAAVELFDGQGATARGIVANIAKKAVVVDQLVVIEPAREPRVDVTLAIGWLRTDHMDAVIRDATMLGVREIQPLLTHRTTARIASRDTAHVQSRWQRIAIGALKQCGGAWLPTLQAPVAFRDWLERATPAVRLLLVEPGAGDGHSRRDVDALAPSAPADAALVVGPEGGWTTDEVEAAVAQGCLPWSLGARVLRADAVAVAALSALRYAWERDERG
ncbi:MAG: 16S rRNA (uracil(1498)-N(3))-methyltransferase [Acidobacteria bacterium]|nr:16S rRNA (uracil(1498)-N(3))-methyltransferase [Acidobacteriota bacterium]